MGADMAQRKFCGIRFASLMWRGIGVIRAGSENRPLFCWVNSFRKQTAISLQISGGISSTHNLNLNQAKPIQKGIEVRFLPCPRANMPRKL